MNVVAECTLPEKILLAAHQLDEAGQSPFSAEALIVTAWQKYPVTFGLKGYAELYPDSNKVLASIMGEKGLAKRGWLIKVGQKMYTLSREGKQVVRRLLQGDEAPPTPKSSSSSSSSSGGIHIPKDQDKLLNTLFGATAAREVPGRPQAGMDLRRRLPLLEHHRKSGRRGAGRSPRSSDRRVIRTGTNDRHEQRGPGQRPQRLFRGRGPAVRGA